MIDMSLLEKKSLMDAYLAQGPRPLSAFSFVSVFAWGDFFDFESKIIDDCLCIFAQADSGSFLYLPPLGRKVQTSTLEAVFNQLAEGRGPKAAHRIENIPENLLSVFPEGSYNRYTKCAEYLYRKEDLITLRGNAYKSQRHDCNHFLSHHAASSFEAYTDTDIDACMDLYQRWSIQRTENNSDEIYRTMLRENRQVHQRLLTHWKVLGLTVRVLKSQGHLLGYTMGFPLDNETFCIYAEIADLNTTGAGAYLFKSFCNDQALNQFNRINTMDDFAMPNVARAKKAYHPYALIPSYSVSIKKLKGEIFK